VHGARQHVYSYAATMATRGVVARSEQPWAFLRFSLYLVQVLLFIQNKTKIKYTNLFTELFI